jgi:L-ascorbate metabolism protein UlaG (beta-lactamase superfamily)
MSKNGINICFLSDAEYGAPLVREVMRDYNKYMPVDILMIAANGRSGNLDTENCLFFSGKIKPRVLIPMHYGMFKETHSDPNNIVRAVKKTYPDIKPVAMEFKGSYIYSKLDDAQIG